MLIIYGYVRTTFRGVAVFLWRCCVPVADVHDTVLRYIWYKKQKVLIALRMLRCMRVHIKKLIYYHIIYKVWYTIYGYIRLIEDFLGDATRNKLSFNE